FLMDKDKRTDDLEEIERIDSEELAETDLEDVESQSTDKIKKLQKKLKECESEKTKHLDELQRARAEFLNSRKMLQEELARDRERSTESHMHTRWVLGNSFDLAMQDPSWMLCDEKWRKGIEGIH